MPPVCVTVRLAICTEFAIADPVLYTWKLQSRAEAVPVCDTSDAVNVAVPDITVQFAEAAAELVELAAVRLIG